jgi:hypothetical protein
MSMKPETSEEEIEMKKINGYAIRCAMIVVALLLLPFDAFASNVSENRNSETVSPANLAKIGELGTVAWNVSRHSLDMLGITEMECEGTFTIDERQRLWLFQAEPKIKDIDRDGPSHGILKGGDVIVAVDGMLITTRKAGKRFANLTAGEAVEFTVRRMGRTRTVVIVPRMVDEPEVPVKLTIHRSDANNSITVEPELTPLSELTRSIEELSRRSVEIGKMMESMDTVLLPKLPLFGEFNIDFNMMFPRGWIGFGLSLDGSIINKKEGKSAEWHFDDPPTIKSVQPGSPADEAGLQVNDVLLEIDGIKLDSRKGGMRFSRMEPGQIVEWKVQRGGKTFTVETKASERPRREHGEAPPEPPTPEAPQPLLYTGTLDGTEIEVRGGENVRIDVNEETGEIVIRSGDSVTRLKSMDK